MTIVLTAIAPPTAFAGEAGMARSMAPGGSRGDVGVAYVASDRLEESADVAGRGHARVAIVRSLPSGLCRAQRASGADRIMRHVGNFFPRRFDQH